MKKLICLFGLFALLLTSCSSSDSSSTTEESDVLVTRTVETYANDGSTVTTNYTYSGKKVLKSIDSDGYYENYTYTGDLLTKAEIFDMDDNLIQRETFTYNGSAQLVSYVILDFEFNMGDKETYVHNSDGTISTAAFSGDLTSQTNPVSTGVVHFANGEVSSFDEINLLVVRLQRLLIPMILKIIHLRILQDMIKFHLLIQRQQVIPTIY